MGSKKKSRPHSHPPTHPKGAPPAAALPPGHQQPPLGEHHGHSAAAAAAAPRPPVAAAAAGVVVVRQAAPALGEGGQRRERGEGVGGQGPVDEAEEGVPLRHGLQGRDGALFLLWWLVVVMGSVGLFFGVGWGWVGER